jgi:signal transduction histidine kinase
MRCCNFARLEQGFAALSRYAADASHELRTPLAVVAAELDVSLLRPRTPEEWERAAQKSLQEIRQLARLVDSLLELARAEGPLERSVQFDIREPVDQLLARTAEQASANGLILSYAEGGDQPIYVDGDPDALAIAIRNLVDNALRYTPRGGRVRVHLTSERSQVRLAVEDSGPGVPSKEREAIFTPLARGVSKVNDRKPDGYGLGLAIARRIVERHGGSLLVEAAEGGGARFLIRVPSATARREPALPAQP